MDTYLRRARLAVDGSLVIIGLGLAGMLAWMWVLYLRHPGISLVDAYWEGPLPWTPITIWTILAGTLLALVAGAAVVAVAGGWLRRLLLAAALGFSALWWLAALGVVPGPGLGGGPGRPPFPGWSPVDLAYSAPELAAIMVVLPALLVAALALVPRRHRPTSRLAPVHPEPR
jgi:hypothetical protein